MSAAAYVCLIASFKGPGSLALFPSSTYVAGLSGAPHGHMLKPLLVCRAFMQERIHQQSAGTQLGQCVLYFGCRRSDQDYLYGQQLQQWADQGLLTLFTAFSRQQVSYTFRVEYCIPKCLCNQDCHFVAACLIPRHCLVFWIYFWVWFLGFSSLHQHTHKSSSQLLAAKRHNV